MTSSVVTIHVLLNLYMISVPVLRACIVHMHFLQSSMAQVFIFYTTTSLGCCKAKKSLMITRSLDTVVIKPY